MVWATVDGAAASSSAPRVYVINLDRARTRLETISANLASIGVEFERVTAVDGRSDKPHRLARLAGHRIGPRWQGPQGGAEIGCYVSHLCAMRRIVMDGLPGALILEDDIALSPQFVAVLEQLQRRYGARPDARVIVKLEGLARQNAIPAHRTGIPLLQSLCGGLMQPRSPTMGSAAYYISHAAARLFLADGLIVHTFDRALIEQRRRGTAVLEWWPFPARQRKDNESDLSGDRHARREAVRNLRKRLGYRLYRLIRRKWERLDRHAVSEALFLRSFLAVAWRDGWKKASPSPYPEDTTGFW